MAMRALWKGHIRFSLVTIAVRVYAATAREAAVHFHELHRSCLTRLQHRRWCPTDEVEVPKEDVIKGYEIERGQYVPVEEADIDRLRPEAEQVIELEQTVEPAALDPIYIDTPYYLGPDGKTAAAAFGVLRQALGDRIAIGTVVMHGRERLIALLPRERGLMMLTLRHAEEVRPLGGVDELGSVPAHAAAPEVKLARQVLGEPAATLTIGKFHDTFEDALRELVRKKQAGHKIVAAKAPQPTKPANLMDALRRSLEAAGQRAPAAQRPRPARHRPPARRVVPFHGASHSAKHARRAG